MLAPGVRDRILSAGSSVVPFLIDALMDEALAMEDGRGRGWAPIHAARLLGDLGAAEAIEPLLQEMAKTTWDDIIHDAIIQALPKIGASVIEPALRLLGETDDPDVRHSVRAVLSEVGVRDHRIRDILVAEFEEDPELGAMHLASYGDVSVLPLLQAAFERHEIEHGGMFANQALVEIAASIEDLGGELTPAQKDKVERGIEARRTAERFSDRMPVRAAEKLGRNEACWCGNGQKYKKCHLAADEDRDMAHADAELEAEPLDLET